MKRGKQRQPILSIALFLLILIIGVAILMEIQLRPMIELAAEKQLHETTTAIINNAVGKVLSIEETAYDTLVFFEKDEGGQITALQTNVREINLLRTEILQIVLEELSSSKYHTLSLPIGSFTGIGLLSGWGPSIIGIISPLSSSYTTFYNHFSSAGINQTRHQIILNISVDIELLLIGSKMKTTVEMEIPLAETVLVGNIPENYTYFQDGEDLSSTEKSGILYAD